MMLPMSISDPPSTVAASKNYHHGNLRHELLAAARALVAERSIDGFHLREVARRAGVSHTAAYNHFAGKAALVEALVIEALSDLASELRAASESCDDPIGRLERIGCAYVLFALKHPAEFRFMWRPEHLHPRPSAREGEALRAAGGAGYRVLVQAIDMALASGAIEGDPEALVLTAWSAVHGLAALLIDGPERDETRSLAQVETLARSVTSTLIAGMLARPSVA